ncbi:vWA domain-containing protein [Cobetia sp. MC34]|uniref:VWA domain-containing protein n=1 Tax=Cobetia sp. MC34 TaxID=2785080 RepID=UPI001BC91544|nr:vWA domain-containing protein [Cobetia sp. MC34]MBS4152639.1 VWA domain-containing protein [Cobetia sp. MC34]
MPRDVAVTSSLEPVRSPGLASGSSSGPLAKVAGARWLAALMLAGISLASPSVFAEQASPAANASTSESVSESVSEPANESASEQAEQMPFVARDVASDVNARSGSARDIAPDLRMAIDVSGSMKHNDPTNLRASALDLLVTLLPERSRAGLWGFGEQVQPLLALGAVDAGWKQAARGLEGRLDDYEQYTDLEAGLRAAAEGADASIDGQGPRQVILLSDGMVDLREPSSEKAASDSASRQRITDELTPQLAAHNITVHTVALSRNADIDLLQQVADGTGGLATVAETPEDLLRAFLGALDRIVPGELVPLEDKRFTIDGSVEEFTALVFHGPDDSAPVLIAPDGQRYSLADKASLPEGVRWEHQPRYDLITVTDPEAGQWRIEGRVGVDSRITVVSDLALVSRPLPATLYRGFGYSLSASLVDGARDVDEQDFLATLDGNARLVPEDEGGMSAEMAAVTSAQQRGLERDGAQFSVNMPPPPQPGGARLTLTIEGQRDGAPFARQLSQRTSVVDPLLVEPIGGNAQNATPPSALEVSARHPLLNTANTQLDATLQGEPLSVAEAGESRWRIELPPLERDVSADVQISARIALGGSSRVIDLAPYTLNENAARRAANLDRSPIEGESFGEIQGLDQAVEEKEDLNDLLMKGRLPIDKVPALISQWFEGASDFAQREAESPQSRMIAYAVAGVIGLLVVIMLVRRMTRKPTQREEPHV